MSTAARAGVLPFTPPADRGPLLTPAQVAELIGAGVTEAWVRRTVPNKLTLSRRVVRWHRGDVESWLESKRSRA